MNFPFELLPENDFDAVGFGTNAVDYLIRVAEYPAFDSKVELDEYIQSAGGEVASTMAGLQRLGMRTAYAGHFGSDREGEFGLQSLIDEGVDVTYAAIVPDARTQIAFVLIDGQSGERTVIWHRDAKLAYSQADAPVEAATRGRALHLTPHDTKACIRLAELARKAGVVVSADIDNIFDGIEELLPLVDVCLASEEFPEKLLGIPDKRTALREIKSRFGCPLTGLTLGVNGSMVLANDVIIETPSFSVPGGCVDTTGAGDAFRTGFLYGLLSGETVEHSARLANAGASLKCRALGARDALPTQSEMKTLLKNM